MDHDDDDNDDKKDSSSDNDNADNVQALHDSKCQAWFAEETAREMQEILDGWLHQTSVHNSLECEEGSVGWWLWAVAPPVQSSLESLHEEAVQQAMSVEEICKQVECMVAQVDDVSPCAAGTATITLSQSCRRLGNRHYDRRLVDLWSFGRRRLLWEGQRSQGEKGSKRRRRSLMRAVLFLTFLVFCRLSFWQHPPKQLVWLKWTTSPMMLSLPKNDNESSSTCRIHDGCEKSLALDAPGLSGVWSALLVASPSLTF